LDEIGSVVYEEMSFKAKVYGRTTDGRTDGRRTKSDHKSSPCHFVTGELKIRKITNVIFQAEITSSADFRITLFDFRTLLLQDIEIIKQKK
jgi:hypothetical protein